MQTCWHRNVLIESDWNLKNEKGLFEDVVNSVLIESDWNLKILSAIVDEFKRKLY